MSEIGIAWSVAEKIAECWNHPMFVTMILTENQLQTKDMRAKWLSGIGNPIGCQKSFNNAVDLLCFSNHNTVWSYGENGQGGLRFNDNIVSVQTGLSPVIDFLLEKLFLWISSNDGRLHHFGEAHTSISDFETAVSRDEFRFKEKAFANPIKGCQRSYIRINPAFFLEHLLCNDEPKRIHIDILTDDPQEMATFFTENRSPKQFNMVTKSFKLKQEEKSYRHEIEVTTYCPLLGSEFSITGRSTWKGFEDW